MNNENATENIVEKPSYDKVSVFYAWLTLIFAILFTNSFMFYDMGMGAAIFILLFMAASICCALVSGIKLKSDSIKVMITIFLFMPSYAIISNQFILTLVTLYEIIAVMYWYMVTFGNCEKFLGNGLPLDILKSSIVMPFGSFGNIFGAIYSSLKATAKGKIILYIIIGIMVAFVPGIVVLFLLLKADTAFYSLTEYLFSGLFEYAFDNVGKIIVSIPVAMFIFGMIYSNIKKRYQKVLNEEQKSNVMDKMSFVEPLIVFTSTIPLAIIYILFFISQLGYFTSAFSNILPEGYTYSEYARNGFFELCGVVAINTAVIIVALLFVKKNSKKIPGIIKAAIITLCLFTIFLIVVAMSKMVMYMRAYGLTQLRVYTSWFMCLVGLIFIAAIIKQFSSKFAFVKTAVAIFLVMFSLLVYSDVDGVIAKTNVELYKSDKIENIDIYMIERSLSYSAVKYVIPLLDNPNEKVRLKAESYMENITEKILDHKDDFTEYMFSFNFSMANAEKLLESKGYACK